jgi:uncharacterized protein YfaS (alpha-2-macroglobulin family)
MGLESHTPPRPRARAIWFVSLVLAPLGVVFGVSCGGIPSPTTSEPTHAVPLPTGLAALASFPGEPGTTRPAAPLDPLLAADRPEALVLLSPRGNSIHLRRGQSISLRFNRPMVGRAAVGDPLTAIPLVFRPAVPGTATWTNRSTLVFTPGERAWPASSVGEATMTLDTALSSLDGALVDDGDERLVVFDGTPRLRSTGTQSITAGEPMPLFFDASVSAADLGRELLVFEADGGHRTLPVTVRARGVQERGFQVDVVPTRPLQLGARIHMALTPRWAGGTSSYPSMVAFSVLPRPRIDGVNCQSSGLRCSADREPGEVLDIEQEFSFRASEAISAPALSEIRVRPTPPNLALRFDPQQPRRFGVVADWEPDQVYEVRVGNVDTANAVRLERTPPYAIRSRGLNPEVRVHLDGQLVAMEGDASADIRFAAVHADTAVARYVPVANGGEALAALFPTHASDAGQGSSIPLQPLVPDSRANRWGEGTLRWRDGAARRADMAALSFRAAAGARAQSHALFVQQGDLAPNVRVTSRGALVWVTKLSDGSPVANAQVELFRVARNATSPSDLGAASERARTDANGVVFLRATGLAAQRVAVVTRTESSRAVVVVERGRAIGAGHFSLGEGAAEGAADLPSAHVFTDRGAYRPGERVRVRATLRRVEAGDAVAARGGISIRLMGPTESAALESSDVQLDTYGAGAAEFRLPRNASLGEHRVEIFVRRGDGENARDVRVGSASFDVSSFRQPSFRVDVRAPEHAFAGDPLRFEVDANYLFGGRLTGGELRYSLARHGAANYPRAYQAFQFGTGESAGGRGTLEAGVEVLREDQSTVVTIPGDAQSGQRSRVVFEASVTDQAGQSVGADKVVTLYPAAVEVGVRHVQGWIPHAQPLSLTAIVIDRTGAAVPGQTVRGRFVRESYHTFWDRTGGEMRERRELRREVDHECTLRSAAEPVSCEHRPARGGTYVLEAEVTDEAGRRTLSAVRTYVAAADEVPDRDPPGTAITLTSREREYAVGQTAGIAFESPFEQARALVTVDVGGVPEVVAVREVGRGAQELAVPLRRDMVPSALVTVTLVRGRVGAPTATHDLLGPDLRLGAIELTVRPATQAFVVNVEAPANARPGEEVTVNVAVTRDGQPAQVSLALWAVDEGSLRLTDYQRPELDFLFASTIDGDFAWEDLRRTLASRVAQNAVRNGGDGAEEEGALRTLRPEDEILDPTPLWSPTLVTDAQGRARATLRLPARATEYRVMAVVIDAGLGTAGAEATIRTMTDVQVQPALPRFVTEGDSFEVAAFVHNTGERAQELDVVLTAGDRELGRQHLSLAPGRSQRVASMHRVPLGEGTLPLRFAVTGGATAEAVRTLPVAPRAVYRRSHARGFVRGGEEETRSQVALDLPTNLRGRMDLELAPHPLVGTEAMMLVAERATYGGVTHHAARVMLLAAGVATGDAAPEVRATRLQAAVQDLLDGVRSPQHRLSLADHTRVLHALVLAEQAGATVPAAPRAATLTALTRALERPSQGRRSADELTYALRVLVLSGATVAQPMVDALIELRDTLSVGGRASIGLALPDDHRLRVTLLDEIKSGLPEQIDSVSIDALASVLELALRVRPEDALIGEAVASLLRRVEPRSRYGWYSLAAAADAQRALAAYAALLGTEFHTPPTVLVDGQAVAATAGEGGRLRYRISTASLGGAAHALTVVAPAEQAVFFSVDAEWAEPLGERIEDGQFTEPRGAITLHRRYEHEDGRVIASGDRVQLGEMIRVRLFAYGEADGRMFLYDPLPGGVEAIETLNDGSPVSALRAMLGMGPEDDVVGPAGHHAMRSVRDIEQRSLEANGAHFRLQRLGQGLREYTYAVRATSVGRFVAPPAQIESEDDPSVGGDSAAFVLEVASE